MRVLISHPNLVGDAKSAEMAHVPSTAASAVLAIGQETLDEKDYPAVKGIDFNHEVRYSFDTG
jgi:hypothetical protein